MSARESGSQSLPSILHSNPNSPVSSPTLYQNTFRGLSSPYSLTHHGIHRYYGRCSFPPSCRLSQILALLAHPHIHSPQFPIVRNKFYLGTPVVTPNMDSEYSLWGNPHCKMSLRSREGKRNQGKPSQQKQYINTKNYNHPKPRFQNYSVITQPVSQLELSNPTTVVPK